MNVANAGPVVGLNVVEAEAFAGRVAAGRTKPVYIDARHGAAGDLVRCIAKLAENLPEAPKEYIREWVCWEIAQRIGLECPGARAVHLSPDFMREVAREGAASGPQAIPLAFGSVVENGRHEAHLRNSPLTGTYFEDAWKILVLDVFLLNPDRKLTNPNLLTTGTRQVPIDHELACAFELLILPSPVDDDARRLVPDHVFTSRLRKCRRPAPADELRRAVEAVDDGFLGAIKRGVPQDWISVTGQGYLDTILGNIRERRDAVDNWLPILIDLVKR